MTTKFTTGPWRVAPAVDYLDGSLNVDAKQRGYICKAGQRGDAEAWANACLIAAAPDLYAALVAIVAADDVKSLDDIVAAMPAARAALAKAEGRS